jgi:nicotinate-nucleotide adenylyltransferase
MSKTDPVLEPLALFGGTFDPVHYGHLKCADEARQKLNLEYMYLLPAGDPPHRGTPQASTGQRLEMLKLALLEFPGLKLDDRETRRQGPSYMVETLLEFRQENPLRSLVLLIGQDAANLLHTWFQWQQLFSLAHIVILTRPDAHLQYRPEVEESITRRLTSDMSDLQSSVAGKVLQLEVESIDISATLVKELLDQGRSPESMLPATVLDYIEEQCLYAKT